MPGPPLRRNLGPPCSSFSCATANNRSLQPLHRLDRRRPYRRGPRGGEALRAAAAARRGLRVRCSPTPRCLKRAIQTIHIAHDEFGQWRGSGRRHWRLNERHYGALQGLNKKETAPQFGEAQVPCGVAATTTRRLALDAGDPRSAHKDPRYKSLRPEEIPACESLKDTIARMMPCWESQIAPSIKAGKRLIVAAHGNSLRALVMHLDGMSEAEILEFNIPTGVPLVYELDQDLRSRGRRYLGDAAAVAARAAAVAAQGATKK